MIFWNFLLLFSKRLLQCFLFSIFFPPFFCFVSAESETTKERYERELYLVSRDGKLTVPQPFVSAELKTTKERYGRKFIYVASRDGKQTVAWRYGYYVDIFLAIHERDMQLIQELVEENPNIIHTRDGDGNSPLHWAAKYEFIEIVRWLLDKGADPNAQNVWGQNPLFFVSWHGEAQSAEALLDAGADPYVVDSGNLSPQDFTIHLTNRRIIDKLLALPNHSENDEGTFRMEHRRNKACVLMFRPDQQS